MRWLRRIGLGVVGAAVLWIVALAVMGRVVAGCERARTERHLADRMNAHVTIGELDLGLVLGSVGVEELHIARDDGKLVLDVAHVDLDLPPLGLVLVHHGLGDVSVRGVDGTLAPGGLEMHGPKGAPLRFDSLAISDATLHLPAITVHIKDARAGATRLATALSWVFALRRLDATVDLPIGIHFGVVWANGIAHVTLPGDRVLDIPLAIPPVDPGNEKQQLFALGRALLDAILAGL